MNHSFACSNFRTAMSRRTVLEVGGHGLLGLSMPNLPRAEALAKADKIKARAKSVIFLLVSKLQLGTPLCAKFYFDGRLWAMKQSFLERRVPNNLGTRERSLANRSRNRTSHNHPNRSQ